MAASLSSCSLEKRNSTSDVSTRVATIRHIIISLQGPSEEVTPQDISQKLSGFLLELFKQLLTGTDSLEQLSHEDIYTNGQLSKFLEYLVAIGRCAENDLAICKILQQKESKIYGLSGECIDDDQKPMETATDYALSQVQQFPLVRFEVTIKKTLGDLKKSLESCKKNLQELDQWRPSLRNLHERYKEVEQALKVDMFSEHRSEEVMLKSLAEHKNLEDKQNNLKSEIKAEVEDRALRILSAFCGCLSDAVKKWRRVEAWMYAKTAVLPADDVQTLYSELNSILRKYFDFLPYVYKLTDTCSLIMLKDQINEMRNRISSMFFGLQKSQLDDSQIKVYFFPQFDYENRHLGKYLCTDIYPKLEENDRKGVKVLVKNIHLNKTTRTQKRNSAFCCEQFYRMCLVVKQKTENRQLLECLSLPFTVRTGASQLWECEGAVKWYCFIAEDLYTPPFKYQSDMSIDKILTMLQALISTEDPEKTLDRDEIHAVRTMLKTLTDTDTISLHNFVKEHMPAQDRNKDTNKFSCFNWFMAAINTYLFMSRQRKLRDFSDFLSFKQAKAKLGKVDVSSVLIRISRNEIPNPSSKTPYANIVIHLYTPTEMKSYVLRVEDLKTCSLSRWLKLFKDKTGHRLALSVLPHNIPVEELVENSENYEQEHINGYRTRSRTTPGDIIILDNKFEKMHVNSAANLQTMNDSSSSQVPAKVARTDSSDHMKFLCSSATRGLSGSQAEVDLPPRSSSCDDKIPDLKDLVSTVRMTEEEIRYHLEQFSPVCPNEVQFSPLLPDEEQIIPVPPNESSLNQLLENCMEEDSL